MSLVIRKARATGLRVSRASTCAIESPSLVEITFTMAVSSHPTVFPSPGRPKASYPWTYPQNVRPELRRQNKPFPRWSVITFVCSGVNWRSLR